MTPINEIRAYLSYNKIRGELGYWGVPSGNEVDLVWKKGSSAIGFEFKYQENWKSEFNSGLNVLLSTNKIKKAYGVYLGKTALKFDSVIILPIKDFLRLLHSHKIIE